MAEDKKKPKMESVSEPKTAKEPDGEPVVDVPSAPADSAPEADPTFTTTQFDTGDTGIPPDAKLTMDTNQIPQKAAQTAQANGWLPPSKISNDDDPVSLLKDIRDLLREIRDKSKQEGSGVTLG